MLARYAYGKVVRQFRRSSLQFLRWQFMVGALLLPHQLHFSGEIDDQFVGGPAAESHWHVVWDSRRGGNTFTRRSENQACTEDLLR